MGSADLASMHSVICAYSAIASRDTSLIAEFTGWNDQSGYAYISLDNGVCIASAFDGPVEYIATDLEDGTEYFYASYETAVKKQEKLYKKHDEQYG